MKGIVSKSILMVYRFQKAMNCHCLLGMKMILLLFTCSFMAPAQSTSIGYYEHDDYAHSAFYVEGNFYILSNGDQTSRAGIHSYDKWGKSRFSKPLIANENIRVSVAVLSAKGNIIVAGTSHGCDYGFDHKFICMSDSTGNVLWRKDFIPGKDISAITAFSDSSLLVATGNVLTQYTDSGSTLWPAIQVSVDSFYSMIKIPGGDLIACYNKQNSHFIGEIDFWNGLPKTSVPSGKVTKMFLLSSGSVIGLDVNGTLSKVTSGLSATTQFTPAFKTADMFVFRDTVYLLGKDHRYAVLDSSFNQIHALNSHCLEGAVLAAGDGRAVIVANSEGFSSGRTTGRYMGVTFFPALGSYSYPDDASVIQCEDDSSFITPIAIYGNTATRIDGSFSFKVVVKNEGTDTLRDFYLNANLTTVIPSLCRTPYYKEKFTDLNVPPGGTIQVTTRRYDVFWYHQVSGPPSAVTSLPMAGLQVFVSLPNGSVDKVCSNNSYSPELVFHVVGLHENDEKKSIRIFPNPAFTRIDFDGQSEINMVEMVDISGRSVLKKWPGGSDFSIDIQDLPTGLYFVHIYHGGKLMKVEKLLKQALQ